jgi:hypothetical protein
MRDAFAGWDDEGSLKKTIPHHPIIKWEKVYQRVIPET